MRARDLGSGIERQLVGQNLCQAIGARYNSYHPHVSGKLDVLVVLAHRSVFRGQGPLAAVFGAIGHAHLVEPYTIVLRMLSNGIRVEAVKRSPIASGLG